MDSEGSLVGFVGYREGAPHSKVITFCQYLKPLFREERWCGRKEGNELSLPLEAPNVRREWLSWPQGLLG